MGWTDERVELLKRLWADGLSASQIAAELGGVTRNAVIGKVHRLALSGRAKQSGTPRTVTIGNTALKLHRAPQPRRLPVLEDVVVPIPLKKSIIELNEHTCRWPIGDPTEEDFSFCGHEPRENSPYCEYHARVAYQPQLERRRQAAG
jgi:GcrA cell cycle regulator